MGQTEAEVAPAVELFRQNAKIIRHAVQANLEGLTHEQSLASPGAAGNCANWVLGHLTQSYEETLPFMGQERVLALGALDRYRRGSEPLTDSAEAFDFDELLEVWDEAAARIESGLGGLTPESLAKRQNFFGGKSETSLAKFLNFIFFHQAYHAGQLGILRRLAGKEGAIP